MAARSSRPISIRRSPTRTRSRCSRRSRAGLAVRAEVGCAAPDLLGLEGASTGGAVRAAASDAAQPKRGDAVEHVRLDAGAQRETNRSVELAHLVPRERIRRTCGVDGRLEQRLVGVDIADTGEEALIEQHS